LDKKQTLKIRAVKTILPITLIEENKIKILKFEVLLQEIFENLSLPPEDKGILKEFIELDFQKLKIY
jgi:hypothetical protein